MTDRALLGLAMRLEKVMPIALAAHYPPACCLASARIASSIFSDAGYSAEVRPVSVLVASPPYQALIDKHGRMPTAKEAQDANAPSIVIGAKGQPIGQGQWPGHLVTVVNGELLVDFSTGQFSAPQIGFTSPASVSSLIDAYWLAATTMVTIEVDTKWLMHYGYQSHLEGTWRSGSMWNDTAKHALVVADVQRLLDSAI